MKVVADSHTLVFYLFEPTGLSELALDALLQAEDSEGIVVSVATIGDLWYASHKNGPKSLVPGAFELIRRTLLDRLPLVAADRAIALSKTVQVIW